MIYPALKSLSRFLNTDLYQKWGETVNGTDEIVQLNNIALFGEEKNDLQNRVILTLLKVEEETTLKNGSFYSSPSGDRKKNFVEKLNPPLYLNLYLLFSVTKKSYTDSLQLLSDVILFFQGRKYFEAKETQANGDTVQKMTLELHDIGFQETFDMWGSLGGKLFPSVMYKMRLLEFPDTREPERIPVIQKVNTEFVPQNNP